MLTIPHRSKWWCGISHWSFVIGIMKSESFENLRVYRAAEAVGDQVWEVVSAWDHFAKDTIGKQLTRAADSIGANIGGCKVSSVIGFFAT